MLGKKPADSWGKTILKPYISSVARLFLAIIIDKDRQ